MAQNAESAAMTDNASDDFLITEDEKGAMKAHLVAFVSEFYQHIRGYCPEYIVDVDNDTLAFAIEGAEDCNVVARVTPLIEFYFVYRILAWWYNHRHQDLANGYILKAEEYREQILTAIVPRFSTRKLRYF